MKIEKRIISDQYDCVVGCGYYFSGYRVDSHGVKKPERNVANNFTPMLRSLDSLRMDEKESKANWLYVIVNDLSPFDSKEIWESVQKCNNYIYVWLDKNVGCGGKENIIQSISSRYSKRLFRFDADVNLTSTILPLFEAFDNIHNLACATINAGFMGGMLTYNQPNERYISTTQIGNAVIWNTETFEEVGFSNPNLRYFDDLDLVYKALHKGYESVMVTSVTGKTRSSGCGGTMDFSKQKDSANILVESNPLVTYHLSSKGKPHIRYNKHYVVDIFGRNPIKEPPSKTAAHILKKLS